MIRRVCVLIATLAAVLALSGCGGGSPGNSFVPTPPKVSQSEPTILQPLTKLNTDTFTNSGSQHATEVEPDAASNGSTIVAAFQVGRIFGGGSADIGFATSTNGGASWTNGYLPGITVNYQGGTFQAVSDPSVAFDLAHLTWLISSLGINSTAKVVVSRSPDGTTWGSPIAVSTTNDSDKNWVRCDNNSSSPFFGHCYVIWDDPSASGRVYASTSTDGGLTWSTAATTADNSPGIGVVPVIQPNGTVIVPMHNNPSTTQVAGAMLAFRSTDGGMTWSATTTVSSAPEHAVAGGLRTSALPTAAADASGNAYVVWQDCRFRTGCSSNDLVMSTSADGVTWTTPVRIPIDSVTSGADYFIPGLAIEPGTAGSSAHLGLTYYFYPNANCTSDTCSLSVGFISSRDGGNTWTAPTSLVTGMYVTSLASTSQGPMVGDYIATTFSNGKAIPVFAVANLPNGATLDEAMYTTATGLSMSEAAQSAVSRNEPVVSTRSDHPQRRYVDLEGRYPKPPR